MPPKAGKEKKKAKIGKKGKKGKKQPKSDLNSEVGFAVKTTNDLYELRGGIIHDEGGEMILGWISPKTLTLFSAMSSIQFTNFTSHFVALVQLS